jgi:hypothetical protein
MGQWLSIPFILMGVASLIICSRQKQPETVKKADAAPLQNVSRVQVKASNTPHNSGIKPLKKKRT